MTDNKVPFFTAPDGKSNLQFLDKLCRGGMIQRFNKVHPDKIYADRLNLEIDFWQQDERALSSLLSVWNCLYWARRHKVTVNFVSGKLMSSLTAYLLEITQFDPVRWQWNFQAAELQGTAPAEVLMAAQIEDAALLGQYINRCWIGQPCPTVAVVNTHSSFEKLRGEMAVGISLPKVIELLSSCVGS
ncbi:MAG: hypothetical protein ACI38Q_05285 [Candidatus Bruticola sp.]